MIGMFCKWCGMESVTTDQCSWCRRTFSSTVSDSPDGEAEGTSQEIETDAQATAEPENGTASGLNATTEPEALEEEGIKAPWTVAPPLPTPAPASPRPPKAGKAGEVPDANLPIIGIRRPGGGGKRGHAPMSGMAPPASRPAAPAASEAARAGRNRATTAHKPAPAALPLPKRKTPTGPERIAAPPVPAPAAVIPGIRRPTPPATPLNPAASAVNSATAPMLRTPPASTPEPTVSMNAGSAATAPPVAPSGGLAEGFAAPSRPAPAPAVEEPRVPQIGTFQAAKSKYYVGQVIDPVSGTHYDADTGRATATAASKPAPAQKPSELTLVWDELPLGTLVARYAAVFAVILLLAGAIAHFSPHAYVIPLIAAQFVGALLLPVMRVVPWADEDADDVGFLLLVTLVGGLVMVCGPAMALVFYAVYALIRQSANPAVLGCLIVSLLARLTVEAATGGLSGSLFAPFIASFAGGTMPIVKPMLVNWAGLASVAGWYAACVFHKFDD